MANNRLKTAYELAQERTITTRKSASYKEISEAEETSIPEFVKDWEAPKTDRTDEEYEEDSPIIQEVRQETKRIMKSSQNFDTIPVEKNTLQVHWTGDFTGYTGFSRMNRAMVFGLSEIDTIVKVDMLKTPVNINESTLKQLQIMQKNKIDPKSPKVFGATVPLAPGHVGPTILYTMIENL